jgi:hypothetical protein
MHFHIEAFNDFVKAKDVCRTLKLLPDRPLKGKCFKIMVLLIPEHFSFKTALAVVQHAGQGPNVARIIH